MDRWFWGALLIVVMTLFGALYVIDCRYKRKMEFYTEESRLASAYRDEVYAAWLAEYNVHNKTKEDLKTCERRLWTARRQLKGTGVKKNEYRKKH